MKKQKRLTSVQRNKIDELMKTNTDIREIANILKVDAGRVIEYNNSKKSRERFKMNIGDKPVPTITVVPVAVKSKPVKPVAIPPVSIPSPIIPVVSTVSTSEPTRKKVGKQEEEEIALSLIDELSISNIRDICKRYFISEIKLQDIIQKYNINPTQTLNNKNEMSKIILNYIKDGAPIKWCVSNIPEIDESWESSIAFVVSLLKIKCAANNKKYIPKATRKEIAMGYKDGIISFKEIVDKYSTSPTTTRKIIREFNVKLKSEDVYKLLDKEEEAKEDNNISTNSEKVEVSSAVSDRFDVKLIETKEHLVCKMFECRHEDNFVTENLDFIFPGEFLERGKSFDFEYLDTKVSEFIESKVNFDENGIADRDIILYVSGLQSVLGAIFKACVKYKINLTIMNFESSSKYSSGFTYHKQQILEGFPCQNDTKSSKSAKLVNYRNIYTVNTNLEKLEAMTQFYGLQINYGDCKDIYLFDNESTSRMYYGWLIASNGVKDAASWLLAPIFNNPNSATNWKVGSSIVYSRK